MTAAAEGHDHHKHVVIPVLLTCFAYGFYSIGDASLKIIAAKFHFSQIFFINASFIITFMLCYGWMKDGKKAFRTKKPKLLLIRALIAQVPGLCNLYVLPHLQLTTFYTLAFTAPLWVAVLSSVFMKDKLGPQRIGMTVFGFLVILAMFRPGSGIFNVWSLIMLLGTFAYACQLILVRHIGPAESRPLMIMCGSFTSILVALPFLSAHYIPPTPHEWGIFLMIGVISSVGILCVTYAFQVAPSAAIVAPCHYTQIIWGALLGYFFFGEVPKTDILIGAPLLILSGIYLLRHEKRRPMVKRV